MNSSVGKRESWIDCLKFFAIFGVWIDHAKSWFGLYTNSKIALLSGFSVPVFVFLGGATAYYSELRHISDSYWKNALRRCRPLLEAYILSTIIHVIYFLKKFDLRTVLSQIVNFNGNRVFYFVLFYLQLILISRLLASMVFKVSNSKYKIIFSILFMSVMAFVSSMLMQHTYMLPVHGGGVHLFGSIYLFIFVGGMLFGSCKDKVQWSKTGSLLAFVLGGLLLMLWIMFMFKNGLKIDSYVKFGGRNPPGPTMIIYALLVVFCVWSLHATAKIYGLNWYLKLEDKIGVLGRHTLFIFVFHTLVVIILRNTKIEMVVTNIWGKRILYTFAAIFIPILIEYVYKNVKKLLFSIVASARKEIMENGKDNAQSA